MSPTFACAPVCSPESGGCRAPEVFLLRRVVSGQTGTAQEPGFPHCFSPECASPSLDPAEKTHAYTGDVHKLLILPDTRRSPLPLGTLKGQKKPLSKNDRFRSAPQQIYSPVQPAVREVPLLSHSQEEITWILRDPSLSWGGESPRKEEQQNHL